MGVARLSAQNGQSLDVSPADYELVIPRNITPMSCFLWGKPLNPAPGAANVPSKPVCRSSAFSARISMGILGVGRWREDGRPWFLPLRPIPFSQSIDFFYNARERERRRYRGACRTRRERKEGRPSLLQLRTPSIAGIRPCQNGALRQTGF